MMMSPIVRTTTKLVSPFLVTYSLYLMFYGHLSPGGGFQAGVILAVSVIILITSYGDERVRERINDRWFKMVEATTVLMILLMGIIGIFFGGVFYNFLDKGTFGFPLSGGNILIFNILVGLKVGAGFIVIYYALLRWLEGD
ncbi:MAG: Na(+)/H(+) antiporter subunit B [Candidatus Aenigmatarchaeota archaeon]